MGQRYRLLATVLFAGLCASGTAQAVTYQLTCSDSGADNLQGALNGTVEWTSPINADAVKAGDLVELTNICQGNVSITPAISGITITNRNHFTGGIENNDGISGQIEVKGGAQLEADGLILEGVQSIADVYVHDGGSIVMDDVQIESGPLIGLYLLRNASAQIIGGSSIENVGSDNTANKNDGIRAEANSTVTLGQPGGGGGAQIEFNTGNGITLLSESSLESYGSDIEFNGSCTVQCGEQIYAAGASSVLLTASSFVESESASISQPPLIEAVGASQVTIDHDSTLANNGSGVASGALLVASGTTALLNSANLSTTGLSHAVIEASITASVVLGGGNIICAGSLSGSTCTASGGTAIQIDHSSSLAQEQATSVGYAANAAEAITGAGLVQEQSSMDVGQGLVSSSPSISWTTGANGIQVQQNSSFRVSGGVSITGAVTIVQGSNAFANTANGGTNAITSASCPFTNVPSSHWASPGKVSPAVPSATSYSAAVSPQCLAF